LEQWIFAHQQVIATEVEVARWRRRQTA